MPTIKTKAALLNHTSSGIAVRLKTTKKSLTDKSVI
jgi:hypothetical protein